MFNIYTFNSQLFAEIPTTQVEQITGNIVYNGFLLDKSDAVYATNINSYNGPSVDSDTYALPNADGIGLNEKRNRSRIIVVEGTIRAATNEALQRRIEQMKASLSEPNKTLQIVFAGVPRRALAYCNNLDSLFTQLHYNITFVKYRVSFVVMAGVFEDIQTVERLFAGVTAATFNETIFNSGGAISLPVYSITFISATAVTELSLFINGQGISIATPIVTNDVIRIDRRDNTVRKNGIIINWDGVIQGLKTGLNTYQIITNGTFEYDISLQYKFRYL